MAILSWHWSRAVLSARFDVGDSQEERLNLSARQNKDPVDPNALDLMPRGLFFATAAVGVLASLRSGAYYQILVIVIWTMVSLQILNNRLSLQERWFGRSDLTADGRSIPRPVQPRWLPSFLRGLWKTIVELIYAPLGRRPAEVLLVTAAALFIAGSATTFVPAIGMEIPRIIARFFPGPSAAILSLGLALGPLTILSYWADHWHFKCRIRGIEFKLSRPPVLQRWSLCCSACRRSLISIASALLRTKTGAA